MKRIILFTCLFFSLAWARGQNFLPLDLSVNPDTVRVDGDTPGIFLYFREGDDSFDLSRTGTIIDNLLELQGCDWLQFLRVDPPSSSENGRITLLAGQNTSGSPRTFIVPYLLNGVYRLCVIVQYNPGTIPLPFHVTGGGKVFPGKSSRVSLSGSQLGVTYQLYRGTTLVESAEGDGNAIDFIVTTTGTYSVKAVKGRVTASMEGQATVSSYPLLEGLLSIQGESNLWLDKNGEGKTISFNVEGEYSNWENELREIIRDCQEGKSVLWDSSFMLQMMPMSAYSGMLMIARGPNCGEKPRIGQFVISSTDNVTLQVAQQAGGEIVAVDVTGGGEIEDGESASVSLENVQPLVNYILYRNDTLVSGASISGNAFTGLTAFGHYKVKAAYDGLERWMNGGAGVWPVMDRIQVQGGGIVLGNNPVEVYIPTSQEILCYRLERNGVIVDSARGNGGKLAFLVGESGSYSISARFMTRVVPMNGNVNVETSDRIAFTTGKNHVVTTTFIEPSSSVSSPRRVQDVIYLDGFGRTVQEIGVKAAPGGKADIIIPRTYGPGGRTEREFLPFYRVGNNGGFVQDPLNPANWEFLGEGEGPHAMTINTWENSPIDRIVRTVGPGKQWQEGNKANCIEHGVNGMNEVKRFRVNGEGKLVIDGFYAPGTLVKTTSTDEDGNVRLSYSANDGNSLLEVAINGTERLETYIVTDDLGRTRFILSPEASRLTGNAVDSSVIEKLAFQYDYDDRGNVIMKKLPGVEPVYMIYDKRDRLVLSQDGNQRNDNPAEWNYARFDDRNRPVETGTVIVEGFTSTRDLRETARNVVNFNPAGARTPLQFTVYDSYEPTGDVSPLPFVPADGFDSTRLELVAGLVTSVKTRILDSGTWLTTTYYYDSRGRMALVTGQNATGGVSRLYTYRDFSGNVIKKREEHQVDGKTTVITTSMELDDRGRVMASETSLDGGDPVRATWSYDPVGRLVTTSRGNVLEDTIRYNPRGWVTGKRNSFFSIELAYGNPVSGANPSWNGNISEIRWRHGNGDLLAYAFSYDGVNRITDAYQLKKVGNAWVEMTDGFNENGIQYDGNGNITAMTRTAGGTTVDNLLYTYSGNRLVSLRECANPGGNVDVMERGNAEGGSYSHDDNGNMTSDSRKALNFEYNSLNLLREVKTTAGTTKARYRWLADGSKLSVRDGEGNAGFDYLGSLTFKVDRAGRRLETAAFDGGIFRVGENGQVEVNYFITDHLGSVREIIDGEGNVIERNDYYPFGARHPRLDYQLSDNRYKFNGKEEQVTGNIGFIDYGARMYDPRIARWFNVDIYSENMPGISVYAYALNNPICLVDVLGLYPGGPIYDGGLLDEVVVKPAKSAPTTDLSGSIAINLRWRTSAYAFTSGFNRLHNLGRLSRYDDVPIVWRNDLTNNGLIMLQMLLDAGGLVPVFGEIFDGINALIYLANGDYVNASLSMAAMIPVAGVGATGMKALNNSLKIIDNSKDVAQHVIKFRTFNRRNFRHNLIKLTGGNNPGKGVQAHHVFPHKYRDVFEEVGIDVNDPHYGVWWETKSHLQNAKAYNDIWAEFLKEGTTKEDIFNKARELAKKYNYKLNF